MYGTNGTYEQGHAGSLYINSRNATEAAETVDDCYPGASKGDMLYSFLNATVGKGIADVPTQDVFDVMAISLAIEDSLKTKQPVLVKYPQLPNI